MKTNRSFRRAFTLMEMLVVIAIIAILASILIPTMSTSRDRARTAYCANNLNQLGKALISYCDEHKEYLPAVSLTLSESYWDVALLPYVGFATNLFFCPSDPFRTGENNLRTYAANGGAEAENYLLPLLPPFGNYGAPPGRKPMRMSDLDMNKGDIILIGERPGNSTLDRGKVGQFAFCGLGQTTTGMHDKGRRANYLMASLSVQCYSTNIIGIQTCSNNYWTVHTN